MNIQRIKKMIADRANRENLYNTAQYWDGKAYIYDGSAVSMWANQHLNQFYHEETLAVINTFFKEPAGLTVLDAGCGTGRFSHYLSAKGADVLGIDFSSASIELAKKQPKNESLKLDFEVRSVFDIHEENKYDMIMTFGVLTIACKNRQELSAVMKNMHRALKNGGKILLIEPIHKGFLHRVLNMNKKDFLSITRSSGFQVLACAGLHFWPMRILLGYIQWPVFLLK